jgi:uncharacterized protein
MPKTLEKKRIWLFLSLSFGISWSAALAIFLTGGLINSPVIIPNTPITLALLLMATVVMFAPGLANILTRLLTGEGKAQLLLKPQVKNGRWLFWIAAWFLPGALTIAGLAVYFLIFPGQFDPNLTVLQEQLPPSLSQTGLSPWLFVGIQTLQAILLAPPLNALPTFGEEFGWRGYLQPKLLPLGGRKAVLITSLIWGIWHWPLIAMGHNYGFDYPGAPFLGLLAMVWFTLTLGILFGWLSLRSDNVWPAVIAHGAINGIASLGYLFLAGQPRSLLGPAPTGLIGGIPLTLTALLILLHPTALKPTEKVGHPPTGHPTQESTQSHPEA